MTSDPILRASLVTASAVVMVIGTLAGFGLLGTRVEESSGGALSSQATLVAPATTAFSIWSLIYLGLIAYVVWQWWARGNARAARISWLAALSMLLNAAWLLVTQVGWLWFSVVVIAALALVLGLLLWRLTAVRSGAESGVRSGSAVGSLVVDGTFGLYLGWVSVATCANIAAAGAASAAKRAACRRAIQSQTPARSTTAPPTAVAAPGGVEGAQHVFTGQLVVVGGEAGAVPGAHVMHSRRAARLRLIQALTVPRGASRRRAISPWEKPST